MTNVAVVILNWNGKKILQEFIPSVVKYSNIDNCRIYLIDNDSADDSISFVSENYPSIKIIKNKENYGFAGGYNEGLRSIEAGIFILLNSDVATTENWLNPIIDFFDENKNTAVIQPKILSYGEKKYFEYAGAAGGFIDKYGIPFCRGRIFDAIEKDKGQYDDIKDIFWASGACFAIRSKVFFEMGGFDELFFAHMEEIDLCWRIHNAGYDIKCIPSSVVFHLGAATLKENSTQKIYLNYRNSMLMLFKNLPQKERPKIIFKRRIFNLISAFKYFLSFNFRKGYIIIKSELDAFRMKEQLLSHSCLDNKKIENKAIIYNKSIIIDYFIRKKRKFTDLFF